MPYRAWIRCTLHPVPCTRWTIKFSRQSNFIFPISLRDLDFVYCWNFSLFLFFRNCLNNRLERIATTCGWPSEGAGGEGAEGKCEGGGEVWGKRGGKLCVCVAEVMCAVCGCGWGSFVCYFCCCCRVRPAAWLPRGRGQWGGQFSAKFCNLLRLPLVVLVVVAQKLMKAKLFQRVHQNVCSSWMLERDSNTCMYI